MSTPPKQLIYNFLSATKVQIFETVRNFFVGDNAHIFINHVENLILPSSIATDRQTQRNRRCLIEAKEFWIKGLLTSSRHLDWIRPGLKEWAVLNNGASGFEEGDQPLEYFLPIGTQEIDVFRSMGDGRSLLILGEPGAGKTIALLKIAESLIDAAKNNPENPIPVVFHLSSWSTNRSGIKQWLFHELKACYHIKNEIADIWLQQQQLIFLLDGLDEVHVDYRNECINELNQFIQDYNGTEIIICCRIEEYQRLEKLKLRKAICIQPLTETQINRHLERPENNALQSLVQRDQSLSQERQPLLRLFSSPLMLTIASKAYENAPIPKFSQDISNNDLHEYFFQAYVDRMFSRRQKSQRYSKEETLHWLNWLASRMEKSSQYVFMIERLQPSWLRTKLERLIYSILVGFFYGLICGFSAGFPSAITYGGIVGLALFLLMGFSMGLSSGIATFLFVDRIVEFIVDRSLSFIRKLLGKPEIPLSDSDIPTTTVPNQEVIVNIHSAIRWSLLGGFLGGIFSLFVEPHFFLIGTFWGGTSMLTTTGRSVILHFSLRLIFYHTGKMPWNYADFLNYAYEQGLLQKIGGGYTFIHRSLQEYLASLPPQRSSIGATINRTGHPVVIPSNRDISSLSEVTYLPQVINHLPHNNMLSNPPTSPLTLFFSYSHKNEDLRDRLATHLKILERQGIIANWHDRQISPGTDWATDIDRNLNAADIILLLVSADFLASDYCYDNELKQVLERHHQGSARVIPIILCPCDWTSAPFGKLQALPIAPKEGAKPIMLWNNQDEAFLAVAQGIRQVAKELGAISSEQRSPPPASSNTQLLSTLDTLNQTLKTMSDQPPASKYNFPKAEKVQIFEKVDTYHEHNYGTTQDLTEAAQDIKSLLDTLAQTYDRPETAIVTHDVQVALNNDPTLRTRLRSAFKAGGIEAVKALFNHPVISISTETLRGFLEAE